MALKIFKMYYTISFTPLINNIRKYSRSGFKFLVQLLHAQKGYRAIINFFYLAIIKTKQLASMGACWAIKNLGF